MIKLTTFIAVIILTLATAIQADTENLRQTPVVRVFQTNRHSVVNINTSTVVRQRFGLFDDDPFFRQFFRSSPFQRDVKRTSLGSGFIIHSAGFIVTNAHVVDGADEIEVNLADGTTLQATVISSDADHDLAIVKITPPPGVELKPVTLGDSSDLMEGEPAIAIGNPLGLNHSITRGIISAVDRPLPITRQHQLTGLIQTDTPINPGNSGGPLLNAYGQVIGITTAIRGDAQSIGFAIPVNQLRSLIADLLSPLAINRVELGGKLIEKRTTTPPADVAVTLLWQSNNENDKPIPITHINDQPVTDIVQGSIELLKITPGQRLALKTNDQTILLEAKQPKFSNAQRLARIYIGITPRELSVADRARMRTNKTHGLLIESITPGGPADRAGLRTGDILIQLGRFRVKTLEDLAVLLSQVKGGERADVYVIRKGQIGRARLKLNQPNQTAL